MPLSRVEALLREKVGLDAASLGLAVLDMVLRRRRAACGVPDLAAYEERLQRDPAELTALIEAVVVPETWFFRDADTWAALGEMAQPWLGGSGPRRILSAPCSTGEEPYSIAITLLAAGMPAERLRIEAMDISAAALAVAQRGVYGPHSFRGERVAGGERWFHPEPGGQEVAAVVRETVRFRQGNLLADEWPGGTGFDLIFCRNVLIYFDADTQRQVLDRLGRALGPQGVLFVGAAEAFLTRAHGFAATAYPGAFTLPTSVPAPPRAPAPRPAVPRRAPARPRTPPPSPAAADLAEVTRLADAGRLAEARAACEAWLRAHETSAAGHCLLGVVRDSLGDAPGARESYRRALYLEPAHPEALRHLALLTEKEGDSAGARRLQRRARRSEESARP